MRSRELDRNNEMGRVIGSMDNASSAVFTHMYAQNATLSKFVSSSACAPSSKLSQVQFFKKQKVRVRGAGVIRV